VTIRFNSNLTKNVPIHHYDSFKTEFLKQNFCFYYITYECDVSLNLLFVLFKFFKHSHTNV